MTVMLLLVIVSLYNALIGGEDGLLARMEQSEQAVSERIMRLNP